MIIPIPKLDSSSAFHAVKTTHATFLIQNSKGPHAYYSSLIGIVTAIVGNVLISFALNIQRYAHIRLNRARKRQEETARGGKRRKIDTGQVGYGTQQADIAEERAQKNKGSTPEGGKIQYDKDLAGETDALIPPIHSRSSSQSSTASTHKEKNHGNQGQHKSYLRSPYWWLGIALMTIGEAGNFLAYGFAPASIVSPLGVVALVSNCLIAPIMLKERFRKRDALGVLIAVAGAVTVVLSAQHDNPKLGPNDIWEAITRWEFETYLGITSFVILCLMMASTKFGGKTILIDLGLVGLFGGYTALSTKGVASLLSYTLWRALTFPITYLLVAVLVSTAVMQIKYVNRALQRFDSTQVIPVQFVLFTIFVITGSAILYRDFEKTTTSKVAQFIGGCALTFVGVWFITSGRGQHDTSLEEESGDVEDAINLVDEERYQDEVEVGNTAAVGRQSHSNYQDESSQSPRMPSTSPASPATRPTHPSITLTSQPQKQPDDPMKDSPFFQTLPQPDNDEPHQPTSPLQRPNLPSQALSAPLLPTDAHNIAVPVPVTPTTPPLDRNQRRQSQPQPPNPATPIRPSTLERSRASIANIVNFGPLTSPLSGNSLRVIVADSLKKGLDLPGVRRKSETRGRPKLGALRQARSARADLDGGGIGEDGSPSPRGR